MVRGLRLLERSVSRRNRKLERKLFVWRRKKRLSELR